MAHEFYVRIEGAKQGVFQGESTKSNEPNRSRCLNFVNLVTSPRDPESGEATGNRRHTPVMLTKEWGAATPQIFEALATGETLKSVLFEFMGALPDGTEGIGFTITLVNAAISSVRQYVGPSPVDPGTLLKLEDVSFTYQTIAIVNPVAKTEAIDNWQD